MSDTSPDIQARYSAMLMALTPEQRLIMTCTMFETAQILARAGLAAQGITDPAEVRVQLFLRFYGNDFPPAKRDRIAAHLRQTTPKEST